MIAQMERLYANYDFEKLCTMRTRDVDIQDDSTPSPAKRYP